MNNLAYNEKFQAEKAKLNPEQRQTVELIEGPVMVLAGPGTGKTQVLAFRIAEILEQTDVTPRNILALTFTESGVTAMRERLASLIGPAAFGVAIYTFHSFANRIINDSGAEFYKSHSLDPIDDITRLKLIISLIDASGNELVRPLRAPYFYVKPIISTIKNLKNEGVSPKELKELCQTHITELEDDASSKSKTGKNKGELKQSVKSTIEKLKRSIALADIYARYEEELTTRGLYDYEDMILFVIKSFQENSDLKAKYQEQFQYILVDEYQDTNNAQNTLVRLLCDYFDNPNLFVVGDDKQSIYRFQGASMANLLNFLEWYPKAQLISLRQNYRSGQVILDNVHHVIQNNREQLALVLPHIHTDLTAQNSDGVVSTTIYPTYESEIRGVVAQIKRLLESGVPASEIAIIYRENSEASDFADLFMRQGIPFHLEAGSDVLRDPDVRQLLNLLELARDPDNEMALFRYIHAPYSEVATSDLVTLGRFRKENRTNWSSLLNGEKPDTDIPLNSWPMLQELKTKVQTWYRYRLNHNLGDTVERIFIDSGLLGAIMQQPDHLERLHRMRCFFDEIKHIVTAVAFATLDDLFEQIEIRQTYNLPLVCLPLVESNNKAIRLMTAHKSKGLEFSYVFVPHCYDGRWSNSNKRSVLYLPEGIVPHHKVSEDENQEEDRRLFYVALTRAKQSVFISYAENDESNKKLLPCQFITELAHTSVLSTAQTDLLPLHSFFTPIRTQFLESATQRYLSDIVTQQPLTPTGLNTFLTCPQEYLYKDVYCIPGVRESFQAFGTAIHRALELWGNWSKDGGTPFTLPSILSVFMESLVKQGLTEEEVARYSNLGKSILTAYYEQQHEKWVPPLATEYSFTPHSVMLDGKIPITGKLDKIEPIPHSKYVRVIDFKTGRVKSRNEIEGKTANTDGDYKRQLVFYTVLAESDPFFPYTVGEASLAFLDDQKKFAVETFVITKAEREELKELIHYIYNEIIQLHFDHTPHKSRWGAGESLCDLLRGDGALHYDPKKVKSIQTLFDL